MPDESGNDPSSTKTGQPTSDLDRDKGMTSYPNTPWMSSSDGKMVKQKLSREDENNTPPADGIGNLSSVFKGMHVYDTNPLRIQNVKVLTRHLNQILLRGDNIVAVALA